MNNNQLYHHGIKGMKWGVRRYRNEDGSLTNAGKKRYAEKEPVHEDYAKVHDNKSVKSMSDAELNARNKRLQAERQYETMTKKTNRGVKAVKAIIAAGALAGGVAATISNFENLSKKCKPAADKALDKIGDMVVKGIKLDDKWD